MTDAAPPDDFDERYRSGRTPWEIGRPQPLFVRESGRVAGRVLELGCGSGGLSLFLAERGLDVVGIDAAAEAVADAERKRDSRGLSADFRVHSALEMNTLPGSFGGRPFDTVIDCLLFHVFDDDDRARYVRALRATLRPGGTFLLLVFSDAEPPGFGPRRVSRDEITAAFADGFTVRELRDGPVEMRPQDRNKFSPGGPQGLFAVIERA